MHQLLFVPKRLCRTVTVIKCKVFYFFLEKAENVNK